MGGALRGALVVGCLVIGGGCANPAPAAVSHPLAHAVPSEPALVITTPPTTHPEKLAADTLTSTKEGATFLAPAGWSVSLQGSATIVEAPEGDSHIAFVDSHASDADGAVAAAWAAYRPALKWPLEVVTDSPDKDGWTNRRVYSYLTSPNEKRDVEVRVQRSGQVWTAVISDLTDAVEDKRRSAVLLVSGRFLPKGYVPESFAGKKANRLDAAHIARLTHWVQSAMHELGIPGVSLGLVQDGKVVFAGGFGVRELGKPAKPDADTLYMIASNTKAMTTLLLAKLVDREKLTWDTRVAQLLPAFQLGDAEITRQVRVKHLICACTGLPRQDLEWLFQFKGVTPEGALATLARVRPTSKFGEMLARSPSVKNPA